MASVPLEREKQIELMQTAETRYDQAMRSWLSNPFFRRMVCEPVKGQKGAYESETVSVPMPLKQA